VAQAARLIRSNRIPMEGRRRGIVLFTGNSFQYDGLFQGSLIESMDIELNV
jgi:hypothetical protein